MYWETGLSSRQSPYCYLGDEEVLGRANTSNVIIWHIVPIYKKLEGVACLFVYFVDHRTSDGTVIKFMIDVRSLTTYM